MGPWLQFGVICDAMGVGRRGVGQCGAWAGGGLRPGPVCRSESLGHLAGLGEGERQLARGAVGEFGGETGHGDLDRLRSLFVLT